MRRLSASAVISMSLLAAGCGQKGALYLPQKNGTVVTRPAPATVAPDTDPSAIVAPDTSGTATPGQSRPHQVDTPDETKDKDQKPQR